MSFENAPNIFWGIQKYFSGDFRGIELLIPLISLNPFMTEAVII